MALTSVEREPGQLRSASIGLRFILLLILTIALMVLDHRNEHLVEVRKDIATLLHPIELLVSAPANLSRNLQKSMASRDKLRGDNERLQQEALILNARMLRMEALEAENARLRALLDSTKKVGDQILIAEILSVDLNPFRNMILINRGSEDGAYMGQAVIDADGVIGQISRDRRISSEAMLITDVDHAIPVELVRNRLRTIAVGTGELDKLSLPYLPVSADIRVGDLLITSGLGGKFPPGYPVGTVRDVRRVTGLPFLEIYAEPAAALNRIREVLLITPPKRAAAAATPPASDVPAANLDAGASAATEAAPDAATPASVNTAAASPQPAPASAAPTGAPTAELTPPGGLESAPAAAAGIVETTEPPTEGTE